MEEYLKFYRGVGETFCWADRILMPDDHLFSIITHPDVGVYSLTYNGVDAGYIELDTRVRNEVEIAYFGIFPRFNGKGLGSYLLQEGLRIAWDWKPNRVWLHTCDLDHPNAISLYEKFGFKIYKREMSTAKIIE